MIVYRFAAPLIFANAEAFKKTGEALLKIAGVIEKIGEERFYDTIRNAVDAAESDK